MSLNRLFGRSQSDEDEHWLSVSDLMAGLMVIFLFIAITYIRPIVEMRDQVREIVVTWNNSEIEIYKALKQEFQEDLPKWHAELDKKTLSVRFKSPDVLFAQSTAVLRPEFEKILEDFFPRYLIVLYRFKSNIAEVRIEGHTSSEWSTHTDPLEAYFRNMELSQARTRAVLEYCLNLGFMDLFKNWARKYITANGLSSSQLILRNGVEDVVRSRRVEFRVRTNAKEQIIKVLETVK